MATAADLNDALKYHIDVDHLGTRRYRNSADLLHRDEGPAVTHTDGTSVWYQNGDLHCTTGPAIIWANGDLEWWQNGLRHRADGPAIEWHDGYKEWWSMIGCTVLMAPHLHGKMVRRSGGSMACDTPSRHIARGSKHWA